MDEGMGFDAAAMKQVGGMPQVESPQPTTQPVAQPPVVPIAQTTKSASDLTIKDILGAPEFYDLPTLEQHKLLLKVAPETYGTTAQGGQLKDDKEQHNFLMRLNDKPLPITDPAQLEYAKEYAKAKRDILAERRRAGTVEAVLDRGGEEVGGIAGGIAGGRTGWRTGAFLAGTGGAAGEAMTQLGQHAAGWVGIDKYGDKAPKTMKEAAIRMATAFARQAGYETGGRAVVGGFGRTLSPFGSSVTPEGRLAMETIDKYLPRAEGIYGWLGKKKVGMFPSEVTSNKFLDVLQNVVEKSILGGGRVNTIKEVERPETIIRMFDDIAEQFGMETNDAVLAQAFRATANKRLDTARIPAKIMYNVVEDLVQPVYGKVPVQTQVASSMLDASGNPLMRTVTTYQRRQIGGAAVPLITLKNLVEEKAELLRQLFPEGQSIEAAAHGDALVKMVESLNNDVPYKAAQELRTRIREMGDSVEFAGKKNAAFLLAQRLETTLDTAIITELRRVTPAAAPIFRKANALWKASSGLYRNEFMQSLMKHNKFNPELVARDAFSNPTKAKAFKAAMDEKTFGLFERKWMDSIRESVAKTGTNQPRGNALYDTLYGKEGLGEETIKQLFGHKKAATLKNSVEALQQLEKKAGSTAGGVAIALAQPQAVIKTGEAVAQGQSLLAQGNRLFVGIITMPWLTGHMLADPIISRYMTRASKLSKGEMTRQKVDELMAITTRLGDMTLKIRKERQRAGEIPITGKDIEREIRSGNIKPNEAFKGANKMKGRTGKYFDTAAGRVVNKVSDTMRNAPKAYMDSPLNPLVQGRLGIEAGQEILKPYLGEMYDKGKAIVDDYTNPPAINNTNTPALRRRP